MKSDVAKLAAYSICSYNEFNESMSSQLKTPILCCHPNSIRIKQAKNIKEYTSGPLSAFIYESVDTVLVPPKQLLTAKETQVKRNFDDIYKYKIASLVFLCDFQQNQKNKSNFFINEYSNNSQLNLTDNIAYDVYVIKIENDQTKKSELVFDPQIGSKQMNSVYNYNHTQPQGNLQQLVNQNNQLQKQLELYCKQREIDIQTIQNVKQEIESLKTQLLNINDNNNNNNNNNNDAKEELKTENEELTTVNRELRYLFGSINIAFSNSCRITPINEQYIDNMISRQHAIVMKNKIDYNISSIELCDEASNEKQIHIGSEYVPCGIFLKYRHLLVGLLTQNELCELNHILFE